jgi:hypothetical protein
MHFQSPQLRSVVAAMETYERQQSAASFKAVRQAVAVWKETQSNEYRAQGASFERSLQDVMVREGLRYEKHLAAQPFLLDKRTSQLLIQENSEEIAGNNYFFHATSFDNLVTIRQVGLDPDQGGKNGAGALVGNPWFVARSQNKVHATTSRATVMFYEYLHTGRAENAVGQDRPYVQASSTPSGPRMGALGVVLRFPKYAVMGLEVTPDPDDPRSAFRIFGKVRPWVLEVLTTEGWVPIRALTELRVAIGA